jgi:DNA-directed RNA polymerase specialized sigma24 family protein
MAEPELETFYASVFLPLVRRATWKHRLSKEDASDIVQDAFVLALGKLDSCGNPKAWLVQVVDHLAINHQRKMVRRAHLAAKWLGSSEERGIRSTADAESGVDH